jgi:hypothetical protein
LQPIGATERHRFGAARLAGRSEMAQPAAAFLSS